MLQSRQYQNKGPPQKSGLINNADVQPENVLIVRHDISNVVHSEENIYYDVSLYNSSEFNIPAFFSDNRSVPLINIPSNYKLSVVKMQADLKGIGMFKYGSIDLTMTLYYAPDNLTATYRIFIPGKNPEFRLFDFNSFTEGTFGFNATALTAYNDIVAQYEAIHGPGSWTTSGAGQYPPGARFDNSTGLFEVYTPIENAESNPNRLQLIFNEQLAFFMDSLQFNYDTSVSPPTATVLFYPGYQNQQVKTFGPLAPDPAQQFIINSQTWQTIERWWISRKLLMTSTSIGTRSESIGSYDTQGNNVNFNILTDVSIDFNTTDFSPGASILYFPTAEYRILDLIRDTALSTIDFTFYIQNVDGTIEQLSLAPGDSLTFKLLFTKSLAH